MAPRAASRRSELVAAMNDAAAVRAIVGVGAKGWGWCCYVRGARATVMISALAERERLAEALRARRRGASVLDHVPLSAGARAASRGGGAARRGLVVRVFANGIGFNVPDRADDDRLLAEIAAATAA